MPHSQPDTYSDEGSLDLMRYVHLVLEKKGWFIAIALSVMLIAITASYVLPKKYKAQSIVFIEQNVISDLVKGIAITPSMDMKIKAIKVTMLSRSMILDVIKALDLDLELKTDAQLDGLIKSLQGRIDISLDEKRGVFMISFADANPVMARDVVNTLTRIYIEENTSTKRKESFEATQFLAEQIEVFKKRIDAAEEEINAFKAESGLILSSDETVLRREIEAAEDRLDSLRIRVNALETSRNLLLKNTPLQKQLTGQQDYLEQLRTRYTDNHPQVKQLENAIAETRHLIKTKGRSELDAVYRSKEYQSIKVELDSLSKLRENIEEEIARNKEVIRKIPALKTQLQELERKRNNEAIIYEQLVSRYGQSEVSKEMELQDKSMSFRVLDPAVVPASHSSPNRPIIILAGIAIGLGLGAGLIILIDLISPSIKNPDDLKEFGLPVLAVVPKVKDEATVIKQRRKDIFIYATGLAGLGVGFMFFAIEFLNLGLVDKTIRWIKFQLG